MRYSQHSYRKPGVYIERADASRVPPVVLRTDIAAFVGIAEQGPLDTPVPIESVRQFSAHFGDFIGGGYLAYVVRAFFENGGRRCWVVRVAQRDFDGDKPAVNGARPAWIDIADIDGNPALRLSASSAGNWGNGLALEWSASGAVLAMSVPGKSTGEYAVLRSVAGLAADELVRIEQPGAAPQYRVIAAVDVFQSKIYWVHPDPARARPGDEKLWTFDPLVPLRILRVAYALAVRRDGIVVAQHRDLHLVRNHPRHVGTVLRATVYWASMLQRSALVADQEEDATGDGEPSAALPRAPGPCIAEGLSSAQIPRPLDVPFDRVLALGGGQDGLTALTAGDFIGEPLAAEDSDFVRLRKSRGLQPLSPIDEIALVAVPDILIQPLLDPDYLPQPAPEPNPCVPCPAAAPPRAIHQPRQPGELPPVFADADIGRVQAALIEHCEAAGDQVALLALPYRLATSVSTPREDIEGWRERFDSRVGALYAPRIDVAEPRGTSLTRPVPPCGHVAGSIARVDLATGVQRAPGNVSLAGVVRVVRPMDDELHGGLNELNVNVLRAEFGQTPLVGGARTLAHDRQWRYLNVVRLMLTIKKAADIALRWTVFEPNAPTLWASVSATLTAILDLFAKRGAFAGESGAASFFVICDESTNPPEAREAGQLVALMGFQPATPCEFIVVRVGRQFAAPAVSLFAAEEVVA